MFVSENPLNSYTKPVTLLAQKAGKATERKRSVLGCCGSHRLQPTTKTDSNTGQEETTVTMVASKPGREVDALSAQRYRGHTDVEKSVCQ